MELLGKVCLITQQSPLLGSTWLGEVLATFVAKGVKNIRSVHPAPPGCLMSTLPVSACIAWLATLILFLSPHTSLALAFSLSLYGWASKALGLWILSLH